MLFLYFAGQNGYNWRKCKGGGEMQKTKRLVLLALLTAAALTIFMIEAQIPLPIPVAGVKLGLANAVTLFALCVLGPREALAVLLLRCVLGAVFSGQPSTLLYSLTGGILSWTVMTLLRRVTTEKQIFILSIAGGICHNIGQILVAILVTRTPMLVLYLPVLLISGILAGAFTGAAAQACIVHFKKLKR